MAPFVIAELTFQGLVPFLVFGTNTYRLTICMAQLPPLARCKVNLILAETVFFSITCVCGFVDQSAASLTLQFG